MIPLSFRFAARELRSGVRGFRIFLACLALGVAAIAAAGSTAEAFRAGLAAQAAEILGGDLAVGVQQREFTTTNQAALARLGRVSYAAASRAMAQAPSGARRLVELRGVDDAYPLVGVQAGVSIGNGSVVSAGAVVTENVPENSLVRGNPATVVQELPTA